MILILGSVKFRGNRGIISQVMLRHQIEVLKDNKGRTLYSHANGEVVTVHKCRKRLVKPRKNEKRCCEELAVWSGNDYTDPAFMKPTSREVTKVCTPRICNDYSNPWFNIGTSMSEKWIKIEDGNIVWTNKPQKFEVTSHSKEEQLVIQEDDIFSYKKKEEF